MNKDKRSEKMTILLSRRSHYQILADLRGSIRKKLLKRNTVAIERCSKGQFFSNTVYLERGMPYFAFVDTNAVLVKKNRQTFGRQKIRLPCVKGAPPQAVRDCFIQI